MNLQDKEKLNYTELAILAMQMVNRPATTSELWKFILQNKLHHRLNAYNEHTQEFSGKTPEATFGRNIYIDSNHFEVVPNSKPKRFFLKNKAMGLSINDVVDEINNVQILPKKIDKKISFHERDLHPLLSYFLKHHDYFEAYSRTIFHEESLKGTRGEDKWLYPDMVAVNFEYANYQKNNVLSFIKKFDILPIKIFSFELKKELNFSNYKESFFQAVSNSSWANEGYLVALEIKQDGQFIEALQKLSQSFGIGIIELNIDNIADSKILSPAKFKEKMDYSVIDELARKSPNFAQFLKTVTDFDLSNTSRFINEFDKVLSDDDLQSHLEETVLKG